MTEQRRLDPAERIRLAAQNAAEFHKGGAYLETDVNRARAFAVVHIEREDESPLRLNLDEVTRETLLFNGRRDAAHALLNTISLMVRLRRVERLLWLILTVIVVGLGGLLLRR